MSCWKYKRMDVNYVFTQEDNTLLTKNLFYIVYFVLQANHTTVTQVFQFESVMLEYLKHIQIGSQECEAYHLGPKSLLRFECYKNLKNLDV